MFKYDWLFFTLKMSTWATAPFGVPQIAQWRTSTRAPRIPWRNFIISALLWDPFCKFLPFLKGWLWVFRSEEPQMMPQAYVHLCMHAEEVRVREGESMSSSAQLPSHCRQGFVLLLAICACSAAQSSGAQHHQLAYRCQNAAFLTLPLCDEEFTSLSCWEEALWCCMNPISLPLQAAVRLRESDAFLPSQRDEAPSRASDLPASLATSAVMVNAMVKTRYNPHLEQTRTACLLLSLSLF